jgi:hypothetical protein
MQSLANPVPDIELPDWLQKKTFDMRFHRQEKISMYGFGVKEADPKAVSARKSEATKPDDAEEGKSQSEPKLLFEQNQRAFLRKSTRNPFSIRSEFPGWLTEQKKIWRNHKRELAISEGLRFQELKSVLQVIAIPNAPGSFTVWFYSGNRIQQLLLHFKRHFYARDKKGLKKAPREEGAAI